MKQRCDKNCPRFNIGTVLQFLDPACSSTGKVEVKPGGLFVVTGFYPGVFQPIDGYWVYELHRCKRDGTFGKFKYVNAWNQEFVEYGGRFVRVTPLAD